MQKIGRVKIMLVSIFILFFSGNLFAASSDQAEKPDLVPLDVVLRDVLETNPDIIEAKEIYEATVSELSIAKSGYYPTIGAEVTSGGEFTDGVTTNYEDEGFLATRAVVYARQNLFNGGKTTNFVDETHARIFAAAWDVVETTNNVFLNVIEAYVNVLKTRELLEISGQNVLTQEQILSQVSEKAAAGFTKVSDLSNSRARLSLAKGNYISAQQDLNQALVKFHRQFGRIILPEQFVLPEPSFQFPQTVEENVDFAFRNHPALKVAEYNIHARKSGYERSKGDYWPKLDLELRGMYTDDVDGDDGDETQYSAMLKLGYVFWDGGVRAGEKGKKYQYLLKEYQRAYIERRNVNQAVRLAWNIDEAEKVKKEFLDAHVLQSAETLDAFKQEYDLGRRTLLDILNMENEYSAAKVANTESVYNGLIAYYRISQATGVLIHEFDTGLLEELDLSTEIPSGLAPYVKKILGPYAEKILTPDIAAMSGVLPLAGILPLPAALAPIAEEIAGNMLNSDIPNDIASGDLPLPVALEAHEKKIQNPDRDTDAVKDMGDQCDNSMEGTEVLPFGCAGDMSQKIGYESPDSLSPYIDTTKDEQSIHLNTIQFQYNSAKLTDEAKQILESVASQLNNGAADYNIEVIGHTCDIGSKEYNQALSEARAASVVEELKRQGVSEERLSSSGKGELEPIADNSTLEGKRKNRRIEFKLTR